MTMDLVAKAYELVYTVRSGCAGVGNLGVVFQNGDAEYENGLACYNFIPPRIIPSKKKKGKYFVQAVQPAARYTKAPTYLDEYRRFCDWIGNKSHWAPIYVTKNCDFMACVGTIFDMEKCNTHLGINVANFHRDFYEHPTRILGWDLFTKAGCEPHLALVLAHYFYPIGGELHSPTQLYKTVDRFDMSPAFGGHSTWNGYQLTKEIIRNIVDNKIYDTSAPFAEAIYTGGRSSIWGRPGDDPIIQPDDLPGSVTETIENAWGKSYNKIYFKTEDLEKTVQLWQEFFLGGKK